MIKRKPELLAPAGNLEKVKWAFMYGADAVYFGGQNYSLRANAQNLSISEIKEACNLAHSLKKKVYVTINIVFHDEDIIGLESYLKELEEALVDAIIISDPLVLDLAKKVAPKLDIFLSTQQNTLNYEACNYWYNEGVKRIVLGRETSKKDIESIIKNCPVEIETFIQGAMCVSYSGRCMLSNYFTNRDPNRGGCSQICRWIFELYDQDKNKESSDIDFSMTVKDLTMVNHIKELIDMGVASFKIEGRMRSIYYIATVLNVYRKIIDSYFETGKITENEDYEKELKRCANRDSVAQYFLEKPGVNEQYYFGKEEPSNQDFLGIVKSYDKEKKEITLEQRNFFKVGDVVTVFGPNMNNLDIKVTHIKNIEGEMVDAARHSQEIVSIPSAVPVKENDLIRIKF